MAFGDAPLKIEGESILFDLTPEDQQNLNRIKMFYPTLEKAHMRLLIMDNREDWYRNRIAELERPWLKKVLDNFLKPYYNR